MITLVGPYYPAVGGVQVYMTYMARELLSMGFEVTVVSYRGSKARWGERLIEVPTLKIKGLRGMSFILGATSILRREKPDLIISHYASTSGISGLLSGLDYFLVFHGSELKLPKALSKVAASRSRAVICVSNWLRERLDSSGIRVDAVIPGGVESELFASLPPKEVAKEGLGIEGNVVLSVGSLVRAKGFDLIPEVAKIVNSKLRASFLIIGSGPEERSIRRRAKEEGVEDRVTLLGKKSYEETAIYYRAADLLLHPARYEGYGLTALESLAAGTPVVASDIGGIKDAVVDGVDGFLVARDAKAIAERVIYLLEDDNLREEMGRRGRERALKRSWRVVTQEYIDLMREKVPEIFQ
jgi:glycosyltransferase involved in cell wall biosynthesis